MHYVFGYGSLMHPGSANDTLQRAQPPIAEMRVARLHGFVRCWQVVAHRIFEDEPDRQPVATVVLDVRADPGRSCNGILIPIRTAAEWARLDERERHYERLNVTDRVEPLPADAEAVHTYRGLDAHTRLPAAPIVAGAYLDIVDEALRIWGEPFARCYHQSTLACAFPRRDGACRRA